MREIVALVTNDYGTICLACAEAVRPGYPRCTNCESQPRAGWRSLGKKHKACAIGDEAPRFMSCDDEPLRLEVGTLTCALCEEEIEPGLSTPEDSTTVLIVAPQSKRELLHSVPDQTREAVRDAIR
jgi:hypothetical protein